MTEPASIRTKNPGAMWGSALAKKWGSTETIQLHDGLGQGNNIAVFPTYVQGICAQLDLWRTSPNYKNKRFADAIAIWCGHNNIESYINFVLPRVPGMTRDTIMDDAFWRSSMGIEFLKAQAGHEAGKPYPAPDMDFIDAQHLVFAGVAKKVVIKKAGGSVVAGGGAAASAHQAGLPLWAAALIGIAVAVAIFFIWKRQNK